jgi:hypothetical protein
MYDPHTRDSRGFGFVMMDNPEDAAACIAEYDKKDFMGKVMTVAMVRVFSFFRRCFSPSRQLLMCCGPVLFRPSALVLGLLPLESTLDLQRVKWEVSAVVVGTVVVAAVVVVATVSNGVPVGLAHHDIILTLVDV